MNEFDEAIDASGYLRLTTLERTTKLIGNVVSPPLAAEARSLGVAIGARFWSRDAKQRGGWIQRAASRGVLRWLLQGLYNRLFWILSGQSGKWVEQHATEDSSNSQREPDRS